MIFPKPCQLSLGIMPGLLLSTYTVLQGLGSLKVRNKLLVAYGIGCVAIPLSSRVLSLLGQGPFSSIMVHTPVDAAVKDAPVLKFSPMISESYGLSSVLLSRFKIAEPPSGNMTHLQCTYQLGQDYSDVWPLRLPGHMQSLA